MKYEDLLWFNWEGHKSPPNFIDRTGTETENFIILGRAPNMNNKVVWNCICKHCGNYCVKFANNLNKHNSCGCIRDKAIGEKLTKNLVGKRFGRLTVISREGSNSCGNATWRCKCDCGRECVIDGNNLCRNHTLSCGCIKQEKSIGALSIKQILTDNNINFKTEISFPDLRGKSSHPYFYDFAIYDENNKLLRLIEFDGIQHFQDTWGKWKEHDSLEKVQFRDREKNQYALSHNIPLVRIPYWMRDKITLDMLLGDEYLVKEVSNDPD